MDILDDQIMNSESKVFNYASPGKRFINYIIDLIVVFFFLISALVIIGLFNPSIFEYMEEYASNDLFSRVFFMVFYALFMGLSEGLMSGKTLGKYITKTRTVMGEDGSRISFGTAVLRGFCRAIPFDQLSALGGFCHPWHDKISKTVVVDETSIRY
jgi:uncharacterized RDD family membrane protein YckC